MATNMKSVKGITSELAAAIEYMKRGFYVLILLSLTITGIVFWWM
jgi:hypothetical protein